MGSRSLGSTLALTDSTGTVQTSYTFEPFGNTSVTGTATTNSFAYAGRELDPTGLYFYRARYYSSSLQRFISEDPLDFYGGDVNLYGFVRNNPINHIDPYGLDWLNNLSDFSAGAGSALTFGLTDLVNDATGASSVVNKCSGWHTFGTVTGVALSTAIGAGGGAKGLTSAAKGLSNATKGEIGEALSIVENTLEGAAEIAPRNTATIAGFTTQVDSTWISLRGEVYYVESKFGTSGLTAAQRLASNALGDAYHVERWGYDFVGRVGAYTGGGLVLGALVAGRKSGCQ